MIAGKEIDWGFLVSGAEWIGREMKEEVDRARRDESGQFRERGHGVRSGVTLGIDVGF